MFQLSRWTRDGQLPLGWQVGEKCRKTDNIKTCIPGILNQSFWGQWKHLTAYFIWFACSPTAEEGHAAVCPDDAVFRFAFHGNLLESTFFSDWLNEDFLRYRFTITNRNNQTDLNCKLQWAGSSLCRVAHFHVDWVGSHHDEGDDDLITTRMWEVADVVKAWASCIGGIDWGVFGQAMWKRSYQRIILSDQSTRVPDTQIKCSVALRC